MEALIEHRFWCWEHKLQGILQLLSLLSGYSYSEDDAIAVKYGLYTTNADKNDSFTYDLTATHGVCQVALALDEDDRDIVFVSTTASPVLQERIMFLAQLQESIKTIEVDFT